MQISAHLDTYTVIAVFIIFASVELILGIYFNPKRRKSDWLIDIISVSQFAGFIKPFIIFFSSLVLGFLFPNLKDVLINMPLFFAILIILIPDEFSHYWYHRLAHEHKFIWKMHRTHHSSPDYQVSLAFRENFTWFLCMPGLWYAASMVYFGLGKAYIISTLIIGVHDVMIHTAFEWDKPLYKYKILKPFVYILERTIQLPNTHKAHHGLGEHAAPFGNYGQFIFLWDVIFKTAYFPKAKKPEQYGIVNDTQDSWKVQLWWPIIKSKNKESELNTFID